MSTTLDIIYMTKLTRLTGALNSRSHAVCAFKT